MLTRRAFLNSTVGVGAAGTKNINSLRHTGGAETLTVATGANLGTLGILNGAAVTFTIAATGTGVVTLPTTSSANLYVNTGSGAITISAPIANNTGLLTLVKDGSAGTLTLSGVNTYTGGTVINSGTVSIAADSGLGTTTGPVPDAVTFSNSGTLINTGTTITLAATRPFNLNNGALATLNTTAAATNVTTIAGIVSGTGGIITTPLVGSFLTLSGLNTYTGPTFANTGALKAGVATTVANGAFGNNSAVTLANTIGVIVDTIGFTNTIGSLSGGGTAGGTVTLGGATLTAGGNNENTTFSGTFGTNFAVGSNATVTGALTKTGTGVLTLAPALNVATTVASSASSTLTVPTLGLAPGMVVTGGAGIPLGTTISSITSATA